jgi:predicted Rossmann fold nucleotide-binding protein DprA/Smf involved in DNA uptake
MTEIAQLFESALRQNRASLLRKAAINTLVRMPPGTTMRELLDSDAGEAVRALTLSDLSSALQQAGYKGQRKTTSVAARPIASGSPIGASGGRRRKVDPGGGVSDTWSETREERIFRQIIAATEHEPLTIGQMAKRLDVDIEELRGYLTWMKKMGKVTSSGRARATRYQALP